MNINSNDIIDVKLQYIRECPICHSKEKNDFETTFRENFNFKAVQCNNCKLVYIDTVIDLEDLNIFYNKYNYNRNIQNTNLGEKRIIMYKLDQTYAERFIKNGQRLKILDIGGGSGEFLSNFSSNIDKIVLEIDNTALEKGMQTYKNIIFHNNFNLIMNNDIFDIIIFRGTLQYMPDLNKISSFCDQHLSPKGKIILLAIPNIDSILAQIQRQNWNLFNRLEHRYNFGIQQIKMLFNNFNLLDVEYPYHNTPYENYQNDLIDLENIFLKKPGSIEKKFPFFGSMMNLVFQKNNR